MGGEGRLGCPLVPMRPGLQPPGSWMFVMGLTVAGVEVVGLTSGGDRRVAVVTDGIVIPKYCGLYGDDVGHGCCLIRHDGSNNISNNK